MTRPDANDDDDEFPIRARTSREGESIVAKDIRFRPESIGRPGATILPFPALPGAKAKSALLAPPQCADIPGAAIPSAQANSLIAGLIDAAGALGRRVESVEIQPVENDRWRVRATLALTAGDEPYPFAGLARRATGLSIIPRPRTNPMTDKYDDNDFDPTADIAASYPDDFAKERRKLFRPPTADELLESSPYYIEGATANDLVFPGYKGLTAPLFVPFNVGVIVHLVSSEQEFSIFSLRSDGKWSKRIGEPSAVKPKGYRWSDQARGFLDDAGHGALRTVYVNFVRRGDPAVYSARFDGPEASEADKWVKESRRLGMSLWSARWRLFMVERDGFRPNTTFRNWAYELAAQFGDGSLEAPTKTECCAVRKIALKTAPAPKAAAPTKRDNVSPDDELPPYTEPPPVSVYDDDIPF
jgi:hypothetical protein